MLARHARRASVLRQRWYGCVNVPNASHRWGRAARGPRGSQIVTDCCDATPVLCLVRLPARKLSRGVRRCSFHGAALCIASCTRQKDKSLALPAGHCSISRMRNAIGPPDRTSIATALDSRNPPCHGANFVPVSAAHTGRPRNSRSSRRMWLTHQVSARPWHRDGGTEPPGAAPVRECAEPLRAARLPVDPVPAVAPRQAMP